MQDGTKNESSKPGELPLKPSLTPAMGVGGFILIALGAVLALIGSRNLRYFFGLLLRPTTHSSFYLPRMKQGSGFPINWFLG